uniref:Transmembrane protein n=1 Tax=Pithovirus LCPAC201 TaxID=2506591 RepID=A0A481Z618_9VIRU|nr:MAG: transmembrane protein [Pithovirus LCPAC201]
MHEIWIVICVFIVIAIIIGLALWLFWPQITGTDGVTDSSQISNVGFLQACGGTLQCQSNLTCQGGVCLKNDDQSCTKSTDCISNQCVGVSEDKQGICSSRVTGGLNGPSPCEGDLAPNDNGICKGTDGFVGCAVPSGSQPAGKDINDNCLSGLCLNSICQPLKNLGQSCLTGQCQEGLTCSLGFCQITGINTSQEGAFCVPGGEPGCQVLLSCSVDTNTCVGGTEPLGGSCNGSDTFCQEGLICLNDVCSYPVPPGDCSTSQSCSNGYTCSNNKCLGQSGAICSVGSQCLSGSCSKNQLAIFKWNNQPVSTLVGIGWSKVVDLPGGITFSRFVATTSGSMDTFWGLDFSDQPGQGGLYLLSNPTRGSWIKTISGTTQNISFDGQIQTTRTETILTISTDQSQIFALIKITTTSVNTQSQVANVTMEWAIKRVELDVSNSANLISIPNFDPPRTINNDLIEIIDFDINIVGDVVLIGSTNLGQNSNQIYSKGMGVNFFSQVSIPSSIQKIALVRFYFLAPNPNSAKLGVVIDNSINIGYVTNTDSLKQQLLFTGTLIGNIYPSNSRTVDYDIIDVSIGQMDSISTSNIWLSVIGKDNPVTETSYLEVLEGKDFQIPGYIGMNSLLYTSPNFTYTQSEGIC